MTPTDDQPQGILSRGAVLGHRSLLARLPGSALSALMKIGPGWSLLPDGGAVLRPTPKAWEHPVKDVYWLPCDPTAILSCAVDLLETGAEGGVIHVHPDAESWDAEIYGIAFSGVAYTDAHEAALAVLLDACGGEG